jgi:hypothetical protein
MSGSSAARIPTVAEAILKLLQHQGIEFITSAHVDRVSGRSGAIVMASPESSSPDV